MKRCGEMLETGMVKVEVGVRMACLYEHATVECRRLRCEMLAEIQMLREERGDVMSTHHVPTSQILSLQILAG